MLAYRHAFHAGNHADVLKHCIFAAVLGHMNRKLKGYRIVDTHAGAGSYALASAAAQMHREHADGIGRLWTREDAPPLVADYLALVRQHNEGTQLRRYPGSPALARLLMRPQDQLRLFELHPAELAALGKHFAGRHGTEVHAADGYAALRALLPPPTRRGVVLIDPPYEIKTDYARVLQALREALARFAEGTVVVWMPQLQLLEAAQLPQRLRTAAAGVAPKGWLLARLTVQPPRERGFGMLGSQVFVANPPHPLEPALREALPWLAEVLAAPGVRGEWACEAGGR